jgi:hypothetical protein
VCLAILPLIQCTLLPRGRRNARNGRLLISRLDFPVNSILIPVIR